LNLSDLRPETSNFFAKHCQMIHHISITSKTGRVPTANPSERKQGEGSIPPGH
jgi:hypothetical protein